VLATCFMIKSEEVVSVLLLQALLSACQKVQLWQLHKLILIKKRKNGRIDSASFSEKFRLLESILCIKWICYGYLIQFSCRKSKHSGTVHQIHCVRVLKKKITWTGRVFRTALDSWLLWVRYSGIGSCPGTYKTGIYYKLSTDMWVRVNQLNQNI
jgi:hypothetical protein